MPEPTTHSSIRTSRRSRRRPLITFVAAIVAVALGIGAGALIWGRATSSEPSVAAAPAPSNLFVVDATSGWAQDQGGDTWQIHLHDASVLWFRDRPGRGSGHQTVQSLVDQWPSEFPTSPNAAVLAPDGPPGNHPTAVEVTEPSYDAATDTATFTLTLEPGENEPAARWLSQLTENTAGDNGRLILFIDDAADPSPDEVCVPTSLGSASFAFTGSEQDVTVPDGASTAAIVAIGGSGANGSQTSAVPNGGYGGYAAQVTGTLAVTPGQDLQIDVGGQGAITAGGWGLGSAGGDGGQYAGGGGGATSISTSDFDPNDNPTTQTIVVAAGGGGGGSGADPTGYGGKGGDAGAQPQDGQEGELGGGNGGAAAYETSGTGGKGGSPPSSEGGSAAGGGGGGVRGGGGGNHAIMGSAAGGGGAGSSTTGTLTGGSITTAGTKGDGSVQICWS